MRAMIVKEFRELARDKRTIALLLAIPMMLLLVFGYAANFNIKTTDVIIAGPGAKQAQQVMKSVPHSLDKLKIVDVRSEMCKSDVRSVLQTQQAAAVLWAKQPATSDALLSTYTHLYVDGSELFAAQSTQANWMKTIIQNLKSKVEKLQGTLKGLRTLGTDRFSLEKSLEKLPDFDDVQIGSLDAAKISTVLFNPDLKTSWVMVPGLIGMILTFVGIMIMSIGLVRERETGTLEQLAVMPLSPFSIIIGKIVPYFLLALLNVALVTVAVVWIFGVPFNGAAWLFALVSFVFLIGVLGLGVLISVLSQNTGQAIQLSILITAPQMLLSGLIFPLESMGWGVRWLGYALPLTWFNIAAKGIMLRDITISDIHWPLIILAAQAVVFFGIATFKMSRLLTRGGTSR